MKTTNNEPENPSAFPQTPVKNTNSDIVFAGSFDKNMEGMTLRDWFAGKALSALIRNYSCEKDFEAFTTQAKMRNLAIPQLLAGMAYENADAMLAARQKGAR